MAKKVLMSAKPTTVTPDDWVNSADVALEPKKTAIEVPTTVASEEMKRLTLDIPKSLHSRIKMQCAMRGTKMVDEIRHLLEERYPT